MTFFLASRANRRYPLSNSPSQSNTNKSKPPKIPNQKKENRKRRYSKTTTFLSLSLSLSLSPFPSCFNICEPPCFLPWKPFSPLTLYPLSSTPNLHLQRPFCPLSIPNQTLFLSPNLLLLASKNTNSNH